MGCLASVCLGQGAGESTGQAGQEPTKDASPKTWVVRLTPASDGSLGWSAKGVKVSLEAGSNGLSGVIDLGPMVFGARPSPIRVRLSESTTGEGLDRLTLDSNRNGQVDDGEVLETEPKERRGKMWSSFTGSVDVTVGAPDGSSRVLPFPLVLWYVVDPTEPDANPILRWSARGWMEGQFESPSGPVTVCLAESVLDATYLAADSWSLGETPKDAHTQVVSR